MLISITKPGANSVDKEKELRKIAEEIARCITCKKGGSGEVVPGEGSAVATVAFIGEAPGREEAKTGRPFVGRAGKFLRAMITETGLDDAEIFIASPVHYRPDRGTPSLEMVRHGAEHLVKQLSVINPRIIVLLGNTACLALLKKKVPIRRDHGKVIHEAGRTYLVTCHPAYAMRFPDGRKKFVEDFSSLKRLLRH